MPTPSSSTTGSCTGGDVDWNSKVLTNSVKTINEWLDKGFISRNATGMKAEGHHAGLHQGRISDLPDWYLEPGPFRQADQVVRLGRGRHAGINYAVGCAGNLLVIPEKSHHKDLSAKFIDYVLSDDVQNFLGNAGGIPVAADTSKITDAKSKAMIEEYDSYAKDGKLSYYPDYAASNLTDAVPAEFRSWSTAPRSRQTCSRTSTRSTTPASRTWASRTTKNNRSFLSIPTPIMVRPVFGRTAPTLSSPIHSARRIAPNRASSPEESIGNPSDHQYFKGLAMSQRTKHEASMSRLPGNRSAKFVPYLIPGLIGLFAVVVVPFIWNIYLSFTRWRGVGPVKWVGLKKLETPVLRFDVLDFLR